MTAIQKLTILVFSILLVISLLYVGLNSPSPKPEPTGPIKVQAQYLIDQNGKCYAKIGNARLNTNMSFGITRINCEEIK